MTTCTLLNALRMTTAALPLILATSAIGQATAKADAQRDTAPAEPAPAWPLLTLGEMQLGELEPGDRTTDKGNLVDGFNVELVAGRAYRLEVTGQGFTALVFLSTVSGQPIQGLTFEPDATGFTFQVAQSGTYRAGAMTLHPRDAGTYVIRLGVSERDPGEGALVGPSIAHNQPAVADVAGNGGGADAEEAAEDADEVALEMEVAEDTAGDIEDAADEADAGVEGVQMIQAVLGGDAVRLEDGRYFAFHGVELTAGTTYTIDVASRAFDAVGYLFDAQDQQLDTNDNAPQRGTDARMTFTPAASGPYSIGISTAHPDATGGYQVTVTPQHATPPGPRNTPDPLDDPRPGGEDAEDQAGPPQPEVHFYEEAQATGEQSYYSGDIRLEAGQVIVVETFGLSEGCDTVVQLRRSTDARQASADDPIVAENDDDQGMLQSRLVYTVQEAGSYYVAAGVYENAAGSFTLLIRDAYPEKDPITLDVEIDKDSQVILGDFQFDTTQNWIVIDTLDLSPGMDTTVELRQSIDPERASDDDPLLASNDDFFTNDLSSRLYFLCEEPGAYYLRVQNIGKSSGTCTVRIRFER